MATSIYEAHRKLNELEAQRLEAGNSPDIDYPEVWADEALEATLPILPAFLRPQV